MLPSIPLSVANVWQELVSLTMMVIMSISMFLGQFEGTVRLMMVSVIRVT